MSFVFLGLVVCTALPAFMLRLTGVMDDSVFWVVAKSINSGEQLYRDVFFTQPPLFIFIPQGVWLTTSNIFAQRAFLFAVWLLNGFLFSLFFERTARWLATGLFLVSAFILQSYALHAEIFVVTAFLAATLAITRGYRGAGFGLGLAASATLFVKPIAPLVFIPCFYYVLVTPIHRKLPQLLAGALVPALVVAAYLIWQGTGSEFWQQVVLDNSKVGLSLNADWLGYLQLAVAPLLVPLFVGLILLDRRPAQMEWWLAIAVFLGLLALELLRGARHYGLFNLCVLVWMAIRAQDKLDWPSGIHRRGLASLVALAAIFQIATVREILTRGFITDELSAAQFADTLPRGSLQVFGNDSPRIYLLLKDLRPAYAYLFVYDTNRDLVIWDSYLTMIDQAPPDYIAVEDNFAAVEYGQRRSTQLTDANAVRTWIEQRGGYRRLDAGRSLGLTLYQNPVIGGT